MQPYNTCNLVKKHTNTRQLHSRIIQAQIQQFRRGNIITLYKEAFDLEKYAAPSTTAASFDNATIFFHSAQLQQMRTTLRSGKPTHTIILHVNSNKH